MNRLAGETACPTHRQVVWLPCGTGSLACLPRCLTDSFTPSQEHAQLLWSGFRERQETFDLLFRIADGLQADHLQ